MILWPANGAAQTDWQDWETLYKDNDIQVEVSFYYPAKSSCQSNNGEDFKYKYRAMGNGRRSTYYLNWKMDYIDCFGNLKFQENSFEISETKLGDIRTWKSFKGHIFSATSLEAKHYDEETSTSSKTSSGTKAFPLSKDPEKIEGAKKIYMGETIELTVKGGALGIDADWIWYQDGCGGKKIGQGKTLRFSPSDAVKVYVRAEGKKNKTKCVLTTVDVDKSSLAPSGIKGRDKICKGESTTLTVSGGALGLGATWVWYTASCGGKKIGTGNNLSVNPSESTSYFVRAEGKLNTTGCAKITVAVHGKSLDPTSITTSTITICEGQSVSLSVKGGKLSGDATWQWYAGVCGGSAVASGASVSLRPYSTTTYYVRGEGVCNNTNCISLTINVNRKLLSPNSIIAPSEVYKGKKTKLNVPDGNLSAGAEWHWYKGECSQGNYLGSGASIIIRPKANATYYVKGVGNCNETSCVPIQITPIKLHQTERFYSEKKKFLHYGFGIGVEWIQFQGLAQHSTIDSVDEAYIQIQGLGLSSELVLHPLIKEHFSFGMLAGGALGTTPLIFTDGKKTNSNGITSKERYFYTKWNYGGELAFGMKKVKFLLNYNKWIQNNQYEKITTNASFIEEKYTLNEKTNRESVGVGLRFGRYLRTNYIYKKVRNNFDLLYTFSQYLQKDSLGFDFNNISGSIHGISISWWRHNKSKFKADFMLPNANTSFNNFEDPTVQVSLVLFLDRFY